MSRSTIIRRKCRCLEVRKSHSKTFLHLKPKKSEKHYPLKLLGKNSHHIKDALVNLINRVEEELKRNLA